MTTRTTAAIAAVDRHERISANGTPSWASVRALLREANRDRRHLVDEAERLRATVDEPRTARARET